MKKSIITMSSILILVYVILSAIDSSSYKIEKQLWHVQQEVNDILRDPKVVPSNRYENVVKRYQRILKAYPESPYAPTIQLSIGNVFMTNSDYDNARKSYQLVLEKYPDDKPVCSQALLAIGKTYEEQKNTASAIKVYQQILEKHPLTDVGMNVPLYIAHFHLRNRNDVDAKTSFREAESFYDDLSNNSHDPEIGFNAIRLLATTYLAQEKWEEAVQIFGKILLDYAKSSYLNEKRANLIIQSINTISTTKLYNYDLPINIYQKFIEQNPGHPGSKSLEQMIKAFQQLKKQNVMINAGK